MRPGAQARDWVEQRAWENSLEDQVALQQAKYERLYNSGQQKEVVMIGMALTIVVFVLILLNPSKTDAQKEQVSECAPTQIPQVTPKIMGWRDDWACPPFPWGGGVGFFGGGLFGRSLFTSLRGLSASASTFTLW